MELVLAPSGGALPQRPKRARKQRGVKLVAVQPVNTGAKPKRKRKNATERLGIKDLVNNNMLGNSDYRMGSSEYAKGLNIAERIAMSIAAPMQYPVHRFASDFTTNQTAIANPWERVNATWYSSAAPGVLLPSATLPCFVFRSLERAAVVFEPNGAAVPWQYQLYGTDEAYEGPLASFNQTVRTGSGNTTYLHIPYAKPLTTYAPHGATFFAGRPKEAPAGRFFWLNKTDTLTVTCATPVVGGNTYAITIFLDFWDADEGVVEGKTAIIQQSLFAVGGVTTATSVISALTGVNVQSGYYALRVMLRLTNGGTEQYGSAITMQFYDLKFGSNAECFGHRSAADYGLNVTSVSGARVQAAAVRYCNVAAFNDLQGQVTVYQFPKAKHWKQQLDYTVVASTNDSETFDVKEGAYAFLKPQSSKDFELQTYTQSKFGILCDSYYPLKEEHGFLVAYCNITTAAGRSGFFEICHGVEYESSDVWRATDIASSRVSDWRAAMNIVKNLDQYHRNKTHLKEILSKIKQAAKSVLGGVVKYGPTAVRYAAELGAMLA